MWRFSLMVVIAACGRLGFEEVGSSPDAAETPVLDLWVSRSDDRMSGPASLMSRADLPRGTRDLSLREALAIAANHPGPDVIRFDTLAVPPGTTILTATELVVGDTATTIDAAGAGITLAGAPGYAGALLRVTGDEAMIDGLRLAGGGVGIQAMGISGIVLRRLEIVDPASDAIDLDDCAQLTLEDSRVERAGGSAVRARGVRDGRIQRNVVSALLRGIELERSTRVQVADNRVGPGTAMSVALIDSMDNDITGNLLDRGDTGLALLGISHRNLVFRNVIIAPTTSSIVVEPAAKNATVAHNTLYMTAGISDLSATGDIEFNLVSSLATQFVDPAAHDFHLWPGDPAVDAASNRGRDLLPDAPELFLGKAPDLGAVESY